MTHRTLLALLLSLLPVVASAADYYVRAGAAGARTGANWTDAYAALPATLVRGATYHVATGSYPAYTFDDVQSGDLVITIRKATAAAHGTDVGWQASYGTGQAVFASTLRFTRGRYVLDGSVRNEADWFDGGSYGFRIDHAGRDQNIVIASGSASSDITIRHVFIDALVALPSTTIRRYAVDTDTYGGTIATGLRFQRMHVRGSNNVWFLRTTNGALVEHCASDGATGNSANHGEIVNLYYSGNNAVVRYNRWRNSYLAGGGTALVAITYADGLQFYGNVCTDFQVGDGTVGFAGYASSRNRVHNNTFVRGRGYNAGTAWGSGTDNLTYNNLWIDCPIINLAGTHDYNAFPDGNARGEAHAQLNVTGTIFRNLAGGDLRLARATAAGLSLASPFTQDSTGATRGSDGVWDRGAYEFTGAGADATAPTVPQGVTATTVSVSEIRVAWSAASDAVGVTGYRVFRDGVSVGTTAATSYASTGLSAGTSYGFTVSAYDAAGNASAASSVARATTTSTPVPPPPTPQTTLLTTQVPTTVNASDGAGVNYELGMGFQSSVAGRITAIRFWKDGRETGAHTGRIWSGSGTLLASVAFTGETASGWQQQALATPVSIAPNTTYVVSVNTGGTYYVATTEGFATAIVNGPLRSVVGSNGRYGAPGAFPTSTWRNSNYFRDVVFTASPPQASALIETSGAAPVGGSGSCGLGGAVGLLIAVTLLAPRRRR